MKGEFIAGLLALCALVFFVGGVTIGHGGGGDYARMVAAKNGRFDINRAIYKCKLVGVILPGGGTRPVVSADPEPIVVPPKKDVSNEERMAEFIKRLTLLQLRADANRESFVELREEMEAMKREER